MFAVVGEAPVMLARLVRWVAPGALVERTLFETVIAAADQRRRPGAFRVLIPQLSAVELARWRADASREAPLVVDVREPWEFELCRIDGSVSIPLGEIARRIGRAAARSPARPGLPSRRPEPARGDAARRSGIHAGAQPAGRRGSVGARRRSDDEAVLSADHGTRRTRGCRALKWNADDETTLPRHRLPAGARPRESRVARDRRGSAADLPRGAARRSRHRRRPGQLGGDAGEGAAGARRPAAQRHGHRAAGTSTTSTRPSRADPTLDVNRNFRQYNAIVSASQPLFRYQNLVLYDQSKQQVTQADFVLSSAQQDLIVRVARRVFRHPARAVQHRAHREPEEGGRRAARAGEAQFRGRRRDDHRHQRGAGEVRRDRRAGDHRAQRIRQPGDRACARSSAAIPRS